MTAQILNVAIYFFAGSGICSALSSIFPSTSKNTFWQFILDGMNLWAFNSNKAENKDDTRA